MKKSAFAVALAVLCAAALVSCGSSPASEGEDIVATVQTIVVSEADLPVVGAPSPEKISEIEEAWYKSENNPLSFETECVYYTNINGYDVFLLKGLVKKDVEKKIDGYTFAYDSSFTVYAYKSGSFITIEDAYKNTIFSSRDIAIISYIHQKYTVGKNG